MVFDMFFIFFTELRSAHQLMTLKFKSLLNNFIKAIVGLFVNILGGGSTIGHEDCNAGKKGHDDDLGAAAGLGCAARRSPAAVGQCKLTSR